ncbi:protein EARLY-RESPONSIVE TO DEHYDRATION 7, chloroplastic-like isoform X1 [Amaranthus tricolor]|uniref:protein EARLY-RESPONSIVE TO DEHYDRATION 7, chloroplastic-like isoform X1 n=1 Tax=Amaranthus tricolor TaxID=29722 RepID=UPI0025911FE3|nr:protein EARLY-RESPONSIVE TO DEHYDRATION 7, chloroplastic-like isoform X1 [Amaranthus tricolor]
MASQENHSNARQSLYPNIDQYNPDSSSPFISNPNPNFYPNPNPQSSSSLYPSIHMEDFVQNLFPDGYHNPNSTTGTHSDPGTPSAPPELESEPVQETLITVPGAVVNLIDQNYSVELAFGDFSVLRIRQGDNTVAVLACVSDEVQWPLIKEEAIVKVDDSHYFFSLSDSKEGDEVLNYGLTFASKGQEGLLKELDVLFGSFGNFTVQSVSEKSRGGLAEVDVSGEISPEELKSDENKRVAMERSCGAYWTTLAPNVEEYSGSAAKWIAAGSGHLIKGILWCGDITVDRLKWGHEVLKKRLDPAEKKEIDKNTMKRIKRVKRMTKMTKQVATGVLSGVVKVSGFFTSSVANSKVGKKFFSLLPGEMVLASLDGFNRICDAVEVAGKNVMSTTSTVTTGLVTHKYGEEAGKATHEGMGAAGHAIGTAWTVFKIRKALNPKSVLKPTTLAKSSLKAAAAEYKSQKSSK